MYYETSVLISRPIEEVWSFLLDTFNIPRWNRSWLALRPTSPPPLGLGSTFQARMMIFGYEVPVSAEVVNWDPPRAAAVSVRGGIVTVQKRRPSRRVVGSRSASRPRIPVTPSSGTGSWVIESR
jgi:hypothetical protein